MTAIFLALCLALATSAAVPAGNRKLEEAAIGLLADAENRGGEIINKLLVVKSFRNRQTAAAKASDVTKEVEQFLQELLSALTTFRGLVQPGEEPVAESDNPNTVKKTHTDDDDDHHHHRHQPIHPAPYPGYLHPSPTRTHLLLPPGWTLEDLEGLDYNDVLDILGDYTKGFASTLLPLLPPGVVGGHPELLTERIHHLVDLLLDQIRETVNL
ncbi:uncharacterized protein LOC143275468 [Babylonia areolata]|uniref:uncharacterized protein LOC143275468 n=1 Tax=Babylonia areolata TaxID=304850 RepID=UPI003FD68058